MKERRLPTDAMRPGSPPAYRAAMRTAAVFLATCLLLSTGVGTGITGQFTASTSFAERAVTLARAATDTFAGIRPADTPTFVVAQALGAAAAVATCRALPIDRRSP